VSFRISSSTKRCMQTLLAVAGEGLLYFCAG
jgi:hypothetical protein